MSLPSARRPKAVEEDLEEVKKESLKMKVKMNKEDWFMEAMTEWAKDLKLRPKDRSRLTRKVFLRRAVLEAYQLGFSLETLPANWVRTFVQQNELTLFKKKKRHSKAVVNSDSGQGRSYSCKDELQRESAKGSRRISSAPAALASGSKNSNEKPQKREFKKIIDLTNEPPPGWWLQSYAKGIVLPRKLSVYSGDAENIIFYDYAQPKEKTDGSVDPSAKFVAIPHNCDGVSKNFDWWAKETKIKDEKEATGGFRN